MFKKTYNVIGVMSGTSLDGIDLAHIHLTVIDGKWEFEILESETVSYGNDWLNKLKTAVDFSKAELKKLNEDYTAVFSLFNQSLPYETVSLSRISNSHLPSITVK